MDALLNINSKTVAAAEYTDYYVQFYNPALHTENLILLSTSTFSNIL